MNKGVLYAAGSYILWGLLPIYWKWLQEVPAVQILAHRMVWSLFFVALLLAFKGQWRSLWQEARKPRTLLTFLASAILLAINWGLYIWAVNAGFIVETSLGYFINPLVNVVLGVLFLNERMRLWQWIAVGLAVAGVVYLTFGYGALPWIALTLAFSFAFYGLLRKTATLGALDGLTLETALLFLPALAYLLFLETQGQGAFGHTGWQTAVLLAAGGIATATPLLLFAAGARLIPYSLVGVLQYIAPTMQFLIGVLIYDEPFTAGRLVGFSLIWLGLLVYTIEGMVVRRQRRRLPAVAPETL